MRARTNAAIMALTLFLGVAGTRGDDLDMLAKPGASAEERDAAFQRLSVAWFPDYAVKLLTLMDRYPRKDPAMTPDGPPATNHPWTEENLSEYTRISYALERLWNDHAAVNDPRNDEIDFSLSLLENTAIRQSKIHAAWLLSRRLDWNTHFANHPPPPLTPFLARIENIAGDSAQPDEVRFRMHNLLLKYGDANKDLGQIIAFADQKKPGIGYYPSRTVAFCEMTLDLQFKQLDKANRRRYLRYAFALLKASVADGTAYGLADQIQTFLYFSPEANERDLFEPAEKGGAQQLEATVRNALEWWRANESKY